MKTLWSIIRMILLAFLLVLVELVCIALLGILYVKLANLIESAALRYLFAIFWFGCIAAVAMKVGRVGFARILDKD